jgi:hypothetical protein
VEVYGDEGWFDPTFHPFLSPGWAVQKEERMAKNNEPVRLTKAATVTVDGEKVELAAGSELSAEQAKQLGLTGSKAKA